VRILQHPREATHPLGTARIAALGLRQCELLPAASAAAVEQTLMQSPPSVLIYPGDGAAPLSALRDAHGPGDVTLLFIDATWRKSRRMLFEQPVLAALPRYQLCSPPPSRYRIRREPGPGALSTLEAVVHSLALLEAGNFEADALLAVMDWLVDRQIDCMGEALYQRNYLARLAGSRDKR